MIEIIIIFSSIFLILNIIILFSVRNSEINSSSNYQNKISIVVAAKNEAENISRLISSLKELDYPKENFEVIIVDDDSSDETFEITSSLTKGENNFNVQKIKDKIFLAKKGALTAGINLANNPFILITDADCQPPKDWLKIYSDKFDEGFDFIFGPAPFIQENSFANKISCFENLRSFLLMFTAAKLKLPYSAAARNFGFRKSAFEKIKGFSNTTETLSGDDDLLLREAVKNNLKVGTVLNEKATVTSQTKNSIKEYLNQRSRHTKTSLYYLKRHQLGLAFWHIINLLMLFSPVLIPVNNFFIIPFAIKIAADIFIVSVEQKKFGYKFDLLEIVPLQIFYELLLIINFAGAYFRKDSWK